MSSRDISRGTCWIDMHHHLLWGMDDGAQTEEETHAMLNIAAEEGVGYVVATTHATPGEHVFPIEKYLERMDLANAWCAEHGIPVTVLPGCEILYTSVSARLLKEGQVPSLNRTRYALVEFSPTDPFEHLEKAARSLANTGYHPVFAHIERYECLKKIDLIEELKADYGVLMQVNANTFIETKGLFKGRWLRSVMERGLIDLASSDAHNLSGRRCRMSACHAAITRQWGGETADLLCRETAAEILGLS